MTEQTYVMFAIPAYDGHMPTHAVSSLVNNAYQFSHRDWVLDLSILNNCSLVQKARNHLMFRALNSPATHIMCIDSDISWDANDILKLMKHTEKYPVVAGVYPAKNDALPVYADFIHEKGKLKRTEEGLAYARSIPAGFLMLRRDALETMAEKYKDSFYIAEDGEFKDKRIVMLFDTMLKDNKYWGEDVIFCQRLRECGYDILVDLTIGLNHHGNKIYSLTKAAPQE